MLFNLSPKRSEQVEVKGSGSGCENNQDLGVVTLVIQGTLPNDTLMPDRKCGKTLEKISYLF